MGSDLDSVSVINGGLQLHIPLWSIKQRGNLALSFTLRYNSPAFNKDHECNTPNQPCVDTWEYQGDGVYITASTSVVVSAVAAIERGQETQPSYSAAGYYWQVETPDSSIHKLANTGSGVYRAIDASGWMYNATLQTLFSEDGVRYVYQAAAPDAMGTPQIGHLLYVEDTNGNRITLNYTTSGQTTLLTGWTDTLGRIIPVPPLGTLTDPNTFAIQTTRSSAYGSCQSDNNPIIWMPPGGSIPFRFCYTQESLRTYFFNGHGIPDVPVTGNPLHDTKWEATGSPGGLSQVIRPDNNSWTFSYTPTQNYDGVHNYGDLTQVQLPTGGSIGYVWDHNFHSSCSGSTNLNVVRSQVTARTLNALDGNGPQTWQYGVSGSTSAGETIDPLGNLTQHSIQPLAGCAGLEIQTDYYEGQSTLLKTVHTDYQILPILDVISTNTRQDARVQGFLPSAVTTVWPDGTSRKVAYTYAYQFHASDLSGTTGEFPNGADFPFGPVTETKEYDYGTSSSPGALLRDAQTNYVAASNSTALAQNLLVLQASSTVIDGITGESDTVSFGYDESGLISGNASAPGWDSGLPAGWLRGNLTSSSRVWNTTGATLVSSKTFTDTGLVATSTEPSNPQILGSLTSIYEHSAAYQGAWVTKITDALSHSVTLQYDQTTGALVSSTDPNNATTTYTYNDPLMRLTNVSHSGGSHNLASNVAYTYPDALTVVTATTLSASLSPETSTVYYDGLGRQNGSRHADPEGDVLTSAAYDELGRKKTETTPFRSTSDTRFYETVSTSYDAIGRVKQVVHSSDQSTRTMQFQGANTLVTEASNGSYQSKKLTQADGLDRLRRVCEVSSTTPTVGTDGLVDCGIPMNSQTFQGFVTTYSQSLHGVTSINQGQQVRSFTYDNLGHPTDTHNPEAGWIHYDYDNDGNVRAKTMPAANAASGSSDRTTVTYSYDAVHRVQQRVYSGGTAGSPAVPNAYFAYDEQQVDGKSLENTTGRLSSEFTSLNGQTQSKTIYAYDSEGKVEHHYQCVANACSSSNYKDVESFYDAAGGLTSAATAQSGHSVTYNSAHHVTQVSSLQQGDAAHPSQC